MAKEAFSRALMEVGGGLNQMASLQAQKERDHANFLRQESLVRLRGKQRKELTDSQNVVRSEERAADRQFTLDRDDRAFKHREELAEGTRSYQERRLDQQNLQNIDAQGQAALKGIDAQIASTREMLQKAELEAVAGVDSEAKQSVLSQLAVLEEQRRMTKFQNAIQLQKLGDPRYADMEPAQLLREAGYSPEQVEVFLKDAEGVDEIEAPSPVEQAVPEQVAAPSQEPARQLVDPAPASERPQFNNPVANAEIGKGFQQFKDVVTMKPWIRNPKVREKRGLPPLEGPKNLLAAQ